MDRRTTLRWMMAASAAMPLAARVRGGPAGAAVQGNGAAQGYGTDPDLTRVYRAGELWPLILSAEQRSTAAVLCDLVIPADAHSPAASSVGVVDFIDEWVSAPYAQQRQDRVLVIDGLKWLDAESARRFPQPRAARPGAAPPFAALDPARQRAICDDIRDERTAGPAFAGAAKFFARFRDLTAGGFYSTPEGRRDLGYVGNVPLTAFDGPPADLLRRLGLDE